MAKCNYSFCYNTQRLQKWASNSKLKNEARLLQTGDAIRRNSCLVWRTFYSAEIMNATSVLILLTFILKHHLAQFPIVWLSLVAKPTLFEIVTWEAHFSPNFIFDVRLPDHQKFQTKSRASSSFLSYCTVLVRSASTSKKIFQELSADRNRRERREGDVLNSAQILEWGAVHILRGETFEVNNKLPSKLE